MNEEQIERLRYLKLQNEFTAFMARVFPYQGPCQIRGCTYAPYMHCSVKGRMYNIELEVTTSLCLAHYLEYECFVIKHIDGRGIRWLWNQ